MVMKIQPSICLDDWGKPQKTPVRLVGTGIRTWDLPNASLLRYHGATSLGRQELHNKAKQKRWEHIIYNPEVIHNAPLQNSCGEI